MIQKTFGICTAQLLCIGMFLIGGNFYTVAQAQVHPQEHLDIAFQELIYTMGMNFVKQNPIVDCSSAKNALLHTYEEVDQVRQIVDVFMEIDEEIVARNITTVDALLDFEMKSHPRIVQTGLDWLSAYQQVFTIFVGMHQDDRSFEVWRNDVALITCMQDDHIVVDDEYVNLYEAICTMLETQAMFEDALKNCE